MAAGRSLSLDQLPEPVQVQVLKRFTQAQPILVADDDSSLLESIVEFLEMNDFRVIGVRDPVRALRISQTQSISMLISDMLKYGTTMNGIELLYRVRTQQATRDLPFVYLACEEQIKDVPRSLKYDGCVYKPFDGETLLHEVLRVLRQKAFK